MSDTKTIQKLLAEATIIRWDRALTAEEVKALYDFLSEKEDE